ncbi:MAG: DUF1345 domain-containing protein [Candidatus Dormibacteria bacterium]
MDARTRLAIAVAVGVAVALPLGLVLEWYTCTLIGWDVAATVFIGSVLAVNWRADAERTRERSLREDSSRIVADLVLIGASVVSLIDVGFVLARTGSTTGPLHALLLAVSISSVVISWAAVHTIFTLRYARLYYQDGTGIDWHDHDVPAYIDFAYVALTVGMTFQVSDTDITTKAMRRAIRSHALLSYLFGVVIFATTINVVASLLTK